MKAGIFLTLFVLATVLSTEIFAAVSQGSFKSDAHPGKCVYDANTILSKGDTKTLPNCQLLTCNGDGAATIATCGVKAVPLPCKLGDAKYPDADYPKCCINAVHCPTGDSEI
ncbi:uncharacterized protein LOC135429922 [Drosophila montana]|uniref:uncharacterized protein LOC135429922 n=1 Tax=Drosophila montana TaxID=40370 RepID=UPI00313C20D3